MADRLPYFTIGHSTLTVDALAEHLHAAGVTRLIDVRTFPRSRTNPQFNSEELARAPGDSADTRSPLALRGAWNRERD